MPNFGKCLAVLLLLLLGLSPGGGRAEVTERAGRAAEFPVTMPIHRLVSVAVLVPADLKVSDADSYYPLADIVWHGDPPGDRREQVAQIFREAIAAAAEGQPTGQAAEVQIVVHRFHCLTVKSRYTFGGVHSIRFDLTLRDPDTGELLYGPERVVADLRAPIGSEALVEELQQGRSQREVIVAWLAQVIRRQIALPGVVTAGR